MTGVTCIALTSRVLSERLVLEINGGRVVLWHEAEQTKKSLGEYESRNGAILTAEKWTRILLRLGRQCARAEWLNTVRPK